MSSDFDTSRFDADNSDELLAKGVRLIKQRTSGRLEKASSFKNPNPLPEKAKLKDATSDPAVAKIINAVTAHWQEEAFNLGYKKALNDVLSDIKALGI